MTSATAVSTPRLLRITEVADLTGLPRWRLYNLGAEGKGPPFLRVGKVLYYPEHKLVDWINAQSERPAPEPDTAVEEPPARRRRKGARR